MILVTGGTGAMGSVLVAKLARQNRRVRVLCLPHDPFVSRVKDFAADIRYGDISDRSGCAGVCDGVSTVLHLAAVIVSKDEAAFGRINVEGTRTIVQEAVRARVGRFVYVSSASVIYPRPTRYSLSKLEAEDIVKKSGLPFAIARPTLVYGATGGQEFDMYLDYLTKFPVVPFIGSGKSLKRPVFVDDINDGLVAICENQNAPGKTYNLSGGEAISMIDFSRMCLRLLGIDRKPVVHLPVPLCKVMASAMKLTMKDPPLTWQVIAGITQDANLDPTDAIKDLGYSPKKVSEQLPKVFPRHAG
jgi:nucleoside-diphosphate-sugar epimerase